MPQTAGYAAGVETNAVRLNFAPEVTWGVAPAIAFQQLRMTGESFSGTKQRSRPAEINFDRQASAAVTTQESATGALNFALSYGTYDALMGGVMGEDWFAALNIVGAAADITLTTGTGVLSSTTSNKFSAVQAGQWLRLGGFTNATNNGLYRVLSKTNNQTLVLGGSLTPIVTETPAGAAATVKSAGYVRNDLDFQSFFFEKQLGTGLFLRYPGTYFTSMNLNGRIGQYMQGSFNAVSKEETNGTTSSSTGSVVAAPLGRVMDTVSNFKALQLDGAAVNAVIQAVDLTLTNDGAAADYGLGSASAQGMRGGTFTGTARIDALFRNFDLWTRFKNETGGRIDFGAFDNLGAGYMFGLLNATIMNPRITAGGPNAAVMGTFDVELNPDLITGKTAQIDRFAAL